MDAFRRTRYAVTLLILFMALFASAESAILVHAAPAITLAPTSGPVDTTVQLSGSGFNPTDTSCTITSSTSNIVASPTCTINGGTIVASGFRIAIGANPGTYTITVTGNAGGSGDFAQEAFTVTSPAITLSPGSQRLGGEVLVNGTGFSHEDGSCFISSPTSSGVITQTGCSITAGSSATSPTNNTEGSFIVGNVPTGEYTIEVTGCPGNTPCSPSQGDFAQAVLEVLNGPQLFLLPSSGPTGQHVSIEGGFFSASDTTCTISSPSSGTVIASGSAGCAITTGPGSEKNITGSFVVGNVAEGQYVIQVSGNTGDFAQAVFNVTAGAFIQLGVNGNHVSKGQVASGTIGTHVDIEGSQFLPGDALNGATCSVSSPSNGNAVSNGACSFFKSTTSPFNGFVNVTGSFVVGNVPEGQYVITVSGSAGDSAQAVFNVTAGAFIQLGANGIVAKTGQPVSAPIGTHVSIEGSNFLANDAFNSATCSVSSPSNGNAVSNGACSFFKTTGGFVNVTGSFVVGNVPEGQYVITVSGSAGDSAQAILNVTAGAFIQLGVNGIFVKVGQVVSGPTGTHVSVEGSQFLANDAFNSATCSLSSPTSGSVMVGNACSFFKTTGGFVNVTGSFTVGNVAEGQYVIQVSGSAGDSAQAIFNVTAGAFIQLGVNGNHVSKGQVASGPIGTHVDIEGSQFLPNDALNGATCSVSSPSNGNAVTNGACSFFKTTGGFVNVTGSFIIGNVPEGQYAITVSGSAGDSAQAILNVTAGAFIQLSGLNGGFASIGQPAKGPVGTHISIVGSQFLPNDAFNGATCSVSSPSNGNAVSNGACSFFKTTGGFVNVTGSFVVGNVPEGQYVITVSGSAGDSAQAILNVTAGAFIQLGVNGNHVSLGQVASGPIGTHVDIEGSQFLANDAFNSATCSLSSPSNGNAVTNGACSFFKTTSGFVNVTGSFIIGNVPEGQYVIQVSGSAGDSAQALLNVTAGAFIQLGVNGNFVKIGQVASGPIGTHVAIEGSQFLPNDAFNSATCSISSPSNGAIILNSGCSFFKTTTGLVNVTGSFIVGNVQEGQYVIQVSGSAGDSAQAVFNVTAGAFIQLGVTGSFASVGHAAKGPVGTHVSVGGSNFLPGDAFNSATCTLSSPTGSSIIQGGACSFFKTTTGLVNVTGSFIVGNVGVGQYVIQVSGSAGDSAQAIFNVTTGPFIQLKAAGFPGGFKSVGQTASGPDGTSVDIEGSFWVGSTTSCTISSPTSGTIITGAGCSTFVPSSGTFFGFANVTGSFIVGNVLPGQYVIQVTSNDGSFAQAIFNVTLGANITLSPSRVTEPGFFVNVTGTGFLPTDTAAVVSSPGSNAVEGGSGACAIQAGIGRVTCSFLVGNVLPGEYVIQVTGNQGDSAQAVLTVLQGPRLVLIPTSGTIGDDIEVKGSSFLTTDQSCSISSISTPNPILPGSAACFTSVGFGNVTGSFIIGPVSPGQYVIEVTGCVGNNGCAPSVGDFAQYVLNVTLGAPTLTLSPSSAPEESTVSFVGSGLSPTDTGCSLLAYNNNGHPAVPPQDNTLITSSTCSITSPGIATGSFVISPYATTNIPWLLRVQGTPVNDYTPYEPFNVTADVVITPTSGTINTVFTFTGSGFESNATSCTAVTVPHLAASTTNEGATPTCSVDGSTGQVSGSVIVPAGTPSGTYGLMVTDNTGATATGEFTVGTPSALVVLNPASVDQDEPVGVAGTGFNPNDTYCVISSGGTPPWVGTNGVAPNCAISSGYASGSFVVSTTAPGGYYLISIIACAVPPTSSTNGPVCPSGDGLDFASNFLGVTLATTVTTYSTTTTSSSTTTSLSTTTTSMATSFSYSSTTYSTTGILFTTYTHFTYTTVLGQTTSTYTQTTSSTQTQTTVTVSTTTSFTTVGCGPLPCGFAVQPSVNPAPGIDSTGLLAALMLLIPMLLRRLFS